MPDAPLSNRDRILTEWKTTAASLETIKAREAELRVQVVEAFSEFGADASGVEKLDIGWGHELKIEHRLSYKLANANDYQAVDEALAAIRQNVEFGALIASRLVKRELKLSVSEYNRLPPDAKAIIDRVLTIEPASKSVKLSSPTEKDNK